MDANEIRKTGPVGAARTSPSPPRPLPANPDPRWVHRMTVIIDGEGRPVAVADSPDSAVAWIREMQVAAPGRVFLTVNDVPTVLTGAERGYEAELLRGDPASDLARREHEARVLRGGR